MKKKPALIVVLIMFIVSLVIGAVFLFRSKENNTVKVTKQKPKPVVNLVSLKERPYVTLQPLSGRNKLMMAIYDLPKKASSVEVTLEYDRNKGVMDAVFYEYQLDELPFSNEIFMGSKSGGGHITYHDDVIGGSILLEFSDEDYALQVPWRYDDSQNSYSELSSSDGRFQLVLDDPIKKSKVVVMESPGLPSDVNGKVLAGPFYVSTVGELPKTEAEVAIRLSSEVETATILGWDGNNWIEYETSLIGKQVLADGKLLSTYVVISQ